MDAPRAPDAGEWEEVVSYLLVADAEPPLASLDRIAAGEASFHAAATPPGLLGAGGTVFASQLLSSSDGVRAVALAVLSEVRPQGGSAAVPFP